MNTRLDTIFLRIAPGDIAFMKFLFETYEEVAIVRTLDRRAAILVVLVCNDFLAVARDILRSARDVVPFDEIPPPPDAGEDWLMKLMDDPLWRVSQ
jgi:hypothetical protein